MSIGQNRTRNNTAGLNPIIVKEAARNWEAGKKTVNKVLRRYGVMPSMIEEYRNKAEEYYKANYE